MPFAEIVVEPKGPFSWAAALDALANFPPTEHHWRGRDPMLRLTFPLDGVLERN